MATENMHNSMNDFRESMEALLQSICGPNLYRDIKVFAAKHPFIFSAAVAICVFSAVPLLFFLGFAVITLFIALICFLCIEGSIIAIGGIIFIGIVCFISIIVVTLISAVAVAYWIIQYIQSMFCSKRLICINSNVKTLPNDEDKVD